MALFKSTTVEPTLTQRHDGAAALAESAKSLVSDIVADLHEAAAQAADVAVEATAVSQAHAAIADAAQASAEKHAADARRIAELFAL